MIKSMIAFMFLFSVFFPDIISAAEGKSEKRIGKALLKKHANALVRVTAIHYITHEAEQAGRRLSSAEKNPVDSKKIGAKEKSVVPTRQATEAMGTVVRQDGLTIIPYSFLEPHLLLAGLLGSTLLYKDIELQKVLLKSIRIWTDRKTSCPARLVGVSPVLNIALIQPIIETEKKKTSFSFIELKTPDVQMELLDPVFCLNRLGQLHGHALEIEMKRITANITKPIKGCLGSETNGMPVFSEKGDLVGLSLLNIQCLPTVANTSGRRVRFVCVAPSQVIAFIDIAFAELRKTESASQNKKAEDKEVLEVIVDKPANAEKTKNKKVTKTKGERKDNSPFSWLKEIEE